MSLKCAILLCDKGTETISDQVRECKGKGADLVELRLDVFLNTNYVSYCHYDNVREIAAPKGTDSAESIKKEQTEDDTSKPDNGDGDRVDDEIISTETDAEEPDNTETNIEESKPDDSDVGEAGSKEDEKTSPDVQEENEEIIPPDIKHLEMIIKESPLPLVCTIRSKETGGQFEGEPDEKIGKLRQIIEYSPAYIELELDEIQRDKEYVDVLNEAKGNNIKVIISKHNMEECYSEDEIKYILRSMNDLGCDISKICCKITGFTNLANLFSSAHKLRKGGKNFIFKGTGKLGNKCSIYAPLLGSTIAYCSLNKEERAEKHLIDLKSLNQQWDILLGKIY